MDLVLRMDSKLIKNKNYYLKCKKIMNKTCFYKKYALNNKTKW